MHNARHHSPPRLSRGGYCVRDPSALHRGPGRLNPATESSTKPTGPWCLSRGPLGQPERGDITDPAADASWQCCARSAPLYEVDGKRSGVRARNCSTTSSLAALSGLRSLFSPHSAELPVVALLWQGFSHRWHYLFMKQISTIQGRYFLTQQHRGVIDDIIRNWEELSCQSDVHSFWSQISNLKGEVAKTVI